jgi:tetratricopeptide (TPR) repeat protein
LTVLLAATLPLAAAPQARQPPESATFTQLFNEYRHGDAMSAVTAFSRWKEPRVRAEARLPPDVNDAPSLAALALFHTEAGMGRRTFGKFAEGAPNIMNLGNWGLEDVFEVHAYTSYRLIDDLIRQAKSEHDNGLLSFCKSWYIVAVSYCLRWNLACMEGLIEKGEYHFGHDDPEFLLLLGSVREPQVMTRSRTQYIHMDVMLDQEAKWAFRRALKLDPAMPEARLRLGHMLHIMENDPDAQGELEHALRDATATHHLFATHLAALFLGELHDDAGREEAALTYYQMAVESYRAHTASVALGQALARAGHTDEAWDVGRLMFGREGPGVEPLLDPWSIYLAAQSWQSASRIRSMRQVVRGETAAGGQ